MPGAVRAPAHNEDEWLGELMVAAVAGLCDLFRMQESSQKVHKVS
jgi:hypothetical protein